MSLVNQHGDPISSIGVVDTVVSAEIQKAITSATGELFQKLERTMSMQSAPAQNAQPKAYYTDPFAMLDSVGMGYRANPTQVTYETLRQMTERDTLLGSIINTRISQVSAFCREQENKYSVGYLIRLRGKDRHKRRLNDSEKERSAKIERYLGQMGVEQSITRDGFVNSMKKMVRDRLTYDQVNWENHRTRGGDLHQSIVVDPSSVRIADQSKTNPRGIPLTAKQEKSHIMYCQVLNGEIMREFTPREMAFCIANPRSSLKIGGYGFPEPQILIQTVTAHIWAEEWNRKAFSQGSTIKGILNMRGAIDRQKYDAFKRQWTAQVGGITNAWRTPILNSDGIEFVPMQMSNTEMGYQMWIEYLVKIACAIYQMDPSEINFDVRGGAGGQQPVFMGNNEAQQKLSKDRGLKPLLRFFEDSINRNIVHQMDDEFEIAFVGLDAKSEEQSVELRQKQGQTMLTVNELRELDDLDPIEGGEIIANAVFANYLSQKQAQAQQGGGAPGGAPPGGEAPGGEQPTEQPYGGQFGNAGAPPTPGGKAAGEQVNAMAQGPKNHDNTHEENDDMRMLRQNDWSSSIHASQRDSDIHKGGRNEVAEFFEIDL